ncbi:MAG: 50S ribosomal protein L30 [Symbiobacteriaceae bacterium]|nr:50S ribosomal protein L30 [Symbiobacteriaceae bacterium]
MKLLQITLVRGFGGKLYKHRRVAEALGLHRKEQSVVLEDTPVVRGMIFKIQHMVSVTEIESEEAVAQELPAEAATEEE